MSDRPQPETPTISADVGRAKWTGVAIIVAAVSVWCLIHAVGAYKTSPWLSVAVLGFLALFMIIWGSVLWLRQRRRALPESSLTGPAGETTSEVSFSGVVSLALALAAWGVYGLAVWGQDQSMAWQRMVSWIDILLLAVAVLIAMVALSEPRPKRGKLGGLVALGLTLALVVTVVFRLEPPEPTAAGTSSRIVVPATSLNDGQLCRGMLRRQADVSGGDSVSFIEIPQTWQALGG